MKTIVCKSAKLLLIGVSCLLVSVACQDRKQHRKVNDCNNCPTYQGSKGKLASPVVEEPHDMIIVEKEYSEEQLLTAPARSMDAEGSGYAQEYKLNVEVMDDMGFSDDEMEPATSTQWNTESYDVVKENTFLTSKENPLSTFSIDVDNASYTNTRRFINSGSLPPKDAVRVEEFINYFSYDYRQPQGEHPFSINTEIGAAPWNPQHRLVHIGLQGQKIPFDEIEPLNLVFLLDVSGSMSDNNKLPLLKKSLELLVNRMRPQDRVAIVVYAGAAGLVLPSTSGAEKSTILNALNRLEAGGSTAGGEGIQLAYKVAAKHFIDHGVNRVILATDGDFNVGASSNAEMTRLIEEKRETGVFLTVLGFGMGNYKDARMEAIADNGNGNYFYIDNIQESNKVLVDELGSTVYTIAKDVKLQVEFNPQKVQAYRLIGYENRMLQKEDFNDDRKDAGELGAGHTATAIYEIIPVGVQSSFIRSVDELKYQQPTADKNTSYGDELLTVKFRYKKPDASVSKLIVHPVKDQSGENTSENFTFSAAVAGWGMLLRDSEFKQQLTYDMVLSLAQQGKGEDAQGHRGEFIKLVRTAELLQTTAMKR